MFGDLRPSTAFDLHMHSTLSDGRYPPDEVLRRCAAAGLQVVALTDHDLAAPLRAGVHEIDGRSLHVLAAAELSGTHEGVEHHLLVYFPGEAPQGFREFCAQQCRARAERFAVAASRLAIPGVSGAPAEALAGERSLTRYHLAQALVGAGVATNTGDAFSRFLGASHGHVNPIEIPFVDAIAAARSFGGVTSWAHPPLDALRDHVATFAAAGLQGLEAIRPHVNGKARKTYAKAAKRHGLFLTGGSDWHGWRDGELGLFRVEANEIRGFLDALAAA